MRFLCTSRFEIEEEESTLTNEYLSSQEIQAKNEEKELQTQMDLDPDTEVPSQHRLGKRRNSVVFEHEDQGSNELDNDDTDLPLPDTQLRTSGRI